MIWSLTTDKNWLSLEREFSWVADMRGVPQDPRHHAEGDVAVHTQMVLHSLMELDEFKVLDAQSREVVWASALLHDVEKRSTTVVEGDGSITSRGHARRGEFMARDILFREVPTPFPLREEICALVRNHGLPLWLFDKADPVKALLKASLRIELPLLAMLAKADVLGRTCNDAVELLDRIELFSALGQEQRCWTSPRTFSSPLARFVYFHKEDSYADYEPFDDMKGEVIMMCGLPGMGKDRYIAGNCSGLPVVSLDAIRRKHKLRPDDPSATGRAVQEAKEEARALLRKGESFVWNATNITRQMRDQWIDLFVSYKARVRLVYVEVPYKDWIRQNADRDHPVPMNVMERLLRKLEVPSPDEAHAVEYIV